MYKVIIQCYYMDLNIHTERRQITWSDVPLSRFKDYFYKISHNTCR
ncbi:MAG: hypothetical protein ABIN20_03165 [candidate division WOR-3 bacterium]